MNAPDIDPGESAKNEQDDEEVHAAVGENRRHRSDRIGEESDDSGGGEDRGEKIKDTSDKPDVAPESGFDIGIEPAGQRDPAPSEGKGGDKNCHRQGAKDEGQRRARSELRGDESRQSKNSRAYG